MCPQKGGHSGILGTGQKAAGEKKEHQGCLHSAETRPVALAMPTHSSCPFQAKPLRQRKDTGAAQSEHRVDLSALHTGATWSKQLLPTCCRSLSKAGLWLSHRRELGSGAWPQDLYSPMLHSGLDMSAQLSESQVPPL